MPTWLAIVLIALVAIVIVLAIGGALAQKRRLAADEGAFRAELDRADRDLAAAHASDRGFDPEVIDRTARAAFVEVHGVEPEELRLVQVIDQPGTDEDKVVFRAEAGGISHTLVLGRRGDDWRHEPAAGEEPIDRGF